MITTDEVLTEVLNFLSSYGQGMRRRTLVFVQDILNNSTIRVIPQTHESFQQGLVLYEHRLDKG
ncbi:hypothetical protein [Oscillatoria salina]|uniref:hypothetical protein n=1 Tax=Oscillatoria salina TaxID=331517 RepID=UPI001CCFB265|nr:hypothetical protein [Oscillatoria salina]